MTKCVYIYLFFFFDIFYCEAISVLSSIMPLVPGPRCGTPLVSVFEVGVWEQSDRHDVGTQPQGAGWRVFREMAPHSLHGRKKPFVDSLNFMPKAFFSNPIIWIPFPHFHFSFPYFTTFSNWSSEYSKIIQLLILVEGFSLTKCFHVNDLTEYSQHCAWQVVGVQLTAMPTLPFPTKKCIFTLRVSINMSTHMHSHTHRYGCTPTGLLTYTCTLCVTPVGSVSTVFYFIFFI